MSSESRVPSSESGRAGNLGGAVAPNTSALDAPELARSVELRLGAINPSGRAKQELGAPVHGQVASSADPKSETPNPELPKARYIMIGGFLGAGKTTAVLKLARHLHDRGQRVGLITNDQGHHLVDTAMAASHGFPVEEIAGGCFCCRFNSLVDAARKLSAVNRPDVFIAEPVGSCTDLVATVTYPLRRIYGEAFKISPLSVLADPIRARRVFDVVLGDELVDGIDVPLDPHLVVVPAQQLFRVHGSDRKQLEEADLIVINKCDLVAPPSLNALRETLAASFPRAEVLEVSARRGDGLEPWFGKLAGATQQARAVMDVDYAIYGQGEALLGWLNATAHFAAVAPLDGNGLLTRLAGAVQERLGQLGAEIAHLKMTLDPDDGLGDLAVVNLVRNDFVAELSQELHGPAQAGEIVINLRAEAPPEALRDAVRDAVAACESALCGGVLRLDHLECFRPGQPQPTHRVDSP